MKRYRVRFFDKNRSSPSYLSDILKSGITDGVKISFWNNGKKDWQAKYKNGLLNGLDKNWNSTGLENLFFQSFKKEKWQGIEINFNLK